MLGVDNHQIFKNMLLKGGKENWETNWNVHHFPYKGDPKDWSEKIKIDGSENSIEKLSSNLRHLNEKVIVLEELHPRLEQLIELYVREIEIDDFLKKFTNDEMILVHNFFMLNQFFIERVQSFNENFKKAVEHHFQNPSQNLEFLRKIALITNKGEKLQLILPQFFYLHTILQNMKFVNGYLFNDWQLQLVNNIACEIIGQKEAKISAEAPFEIKEIQEKLPTLWSKSNTGSFSWAQTLLIDFTGNRVKDARGVINNLFGSAKSFLLDFVVRPSIKIEIGNKPVEIDVSKKEFTNLLKVYREWLLANPRNLQSELEHQEQSPLLRTIVDAFEFQWEEEKKQWLSHVEQQNRLSQNTPPAVQSAFQEKSKELFEIVMKGWSRFEMDWREILKKILTVNYPFSDLQREQIHFILESTFFDNPNAQDVIAKKMIQLIVMINQSTFQIFQEKISFIQTENINLLGYPQKKMEFKFSKDFKTLDVGLWYEVLAKSDLLRSNKIKEYHFKDRVVAQINGHQIISNIDAPVSGIEKRPIAAITFEWLCPPSLPAFISKFLGGRSISFNKEEIQESLEGWKSKLNSSLHFWNSHVPVESFVALQVVESLTNFYVRFYDEERRKKFREFEKKFGNLEDFLDIPKVFASVLNKMDKSLPKYSEIEKY